MFIDKVKDAICTIVAFVCLVSPMFVAGCEASVNEKIITTNQE